MSMRGSIKSQLNRNIKQKELFKSLFLFWCFLISLLGLPWIFGFFIVDTNRSLVFSYLFTIMNSSQGTIIFIFQCILSKNVRYELLKKLRKMRLLSSSSQNSSNNANNSHQKPQLFMNNHSNNQHLTNSHKSNHNNYFNKSLNNAHNEHSKQHHHKHHETFSSLYNYLINKLHPQHANTDSLPATSTLDKNLLTHLKNNTTLPSNATSYKTYAYNPLNNNLILLNEDNSRLLMNSLPIAQVYVKNDQMTNMDIQRTLSKASSNTTYNQPTTYMSTLSTTQRSSSNSNQMGPILPPLPPPLPQNKVGLLKNFYNVEIRTDMQASKCLSTFKTNELNNRPSRTPKTANTMHRLGKYDENQYLTPEYHNYSMVDNDNDTDFNLDTNFYCDELAVCDGLEDELSNNYVEVEDEFIEDEMNYLENGIFKMNSSNNTKQSKNSSKPLLMRIPSDTKQQQSLKESLIEPSGRKSTSEQQTKSVNEKKVLKTSSPISSASSSTSTSILNSSIEKPSVFVSPNENSKAKKMLQRI